MTAPRLVTLILFILTITIFSCEKQPAVPAPEPPVTPPVQPPLPDDTVFSYADSIYYITDKSEKYIVYPTKSAAGQYYGFPEGIEVDETTGAIDVNKSEAGLRYLVTYVSPAGDTSTTRVVISGITFTDNFYHLSSGDSVANPVYNATTGLALPLNGSIFDEGNGANSGGCAIKTDNAKINLAQTVRNGVFGDKPKNDERKDFDIFYRLNDPSEKALNKLKVRVYYYDTMEDVPDDLLKTLEDRQKEGVFVQSKTLSPDMQTVMTFQKNAKPRPPCVIIIAN